MEYVLGLVIGVILWSFVGSTLEYFGVSNVWFMLAGYCVYPTFQFIHNRSMGYAEKAHGIGVGDE
tara:strand:- start:178 stop:372 length:195 start_codon:yes stop_codon:yes gene_type:complete